MTFLLRLIGVWTFRCGADAVRLSPQAALSGA
jgi:hypothetical protein